MVSNNKMRRSDTINFLNMPDNGLLYDPHDSQTLLSAISRMLGHANACITKFHQWSLMLLTLACGSSWWTVQCSGLWHDYGMTSVKLGGISFPMRLFWFVRVVAQAYTRSLMGQNILGWERWQLLSAWAAVHYHATAFEARSCWDWQVTEFPTHWLW